MYHDATIGNAINIALVRIIYLEQDEVGRRGTNLLLHTAMSFNINILATTSTILCRELTGF